jgi:hypothetical protein
MLAKFIDRPREDSLTAAVFGHLLHLPIELFWQLLMKACIRHELPNSPSELEEILPWVPCDAQGTSNDQRVIPDLLLRFTEFDLLVEAKRWDRPMQSLEQLHNELRAYHNRFGNNKRMYMLAIGGVTGAEKLNEGTSLSLCTWQNLLTQCRRLQKQLRTNPDKGSQQSAHVRILEDTISLFRHHNFLPLKWFDDFDFHSSFLTDTQHAERDFFCQCSDNLSLHELQHDRS